jgi:hypothetical protein
MKNYSAPVGSQITIPVKVVGFVNIMSIQGTIQFDPGILSYSSVQGYSLLPGMNLSGFGTAQVSTGKLTFSWMEPGFGCVNLSDSSMIFSITFNVVGAAGTVSPLTFINAPTPFEVLDCTQPIPLTIPHVCVNGSVSIYTTVSIPEVEAGGFQMFPNEPNPFTENTRFVFSLPEEGLVRFEVYDMLGNKVTSFEEVFQAGKNSYDWNVNNLNGTKLSGGTYFYKMSCGKYAGVGKMLLVK